MKYTLLPNGKIKENNNIVDKDTVLNDVIRLPNRENKDERSNKFSELAGFSPLPTSLFENNYKSNEFPTNLVVNRTSKLRNNSFGFVDSANNVNSNREIEFYNNYNTVFDLKLENFIDNDKIDSMQIFASNLDIYGFPQILTNPVDFVARDTILRVSTLIDSFIAAFIPITTISVMQYILEKEISGVSFISAIFGGESNINLNEEVLQLGSYVTYLSYQSNPNGFLEDISFISNEIYKKNLILTLQSFQRVMNFPRFKIQKHEGVIDGFGKLLSNLIDLSLNFFVGYLFYLVPGIKSPVNFETITLTSISTLIQSLLTSNSSRHIFDLLIRKIIKSNHFFTISKKAKESKIDGESLPNFIESLSSYCTYFYRFIGERIGIGEKLRRIDFAQEITKNDRFLKTRRKDNKLVHSFSSLITNTTSDDDIIYNNAYVAQKNINNDDIKKSYRVSKENLKSIENVIEQDYVPFSLHDLRNNDVIKFHAFIDSISDSFSSSYNEVGGYGRQEKIKTFVNTVRSISLSFRLVATSKEDHDEMWHVINKIVMMVYPQWSKGVPARKLFRDEVKVDYTLPYTQLPSTTPMVRLRLGDLFTSNYNTKSIANTFGFMKKALSKNIEIDLTEEYINRKINAALRREEEFVKWEISDSRDADNNTSIKGEYFLTVIKGSQKKYFDIKLKRDSRLNIVFSLPNNFILKEQERNENTKYYDINILVDGQLFYAFSLNVKTKETYTNTTKGTSREYSSYGISFNTDPERICKRLEMSILADFSDFLQIQNSFNMKNFLAITERDSLKVDQDFVENERRRLDSLNFDEETKNKIKNDLNEIEKLTSELQAQSREQNNNNIINNPITYSYETMLGKGLAGHITSLGIDWDQETPWDVDEGNRAPMFVKISIGFSPVHDIPLGLDHNGTMRAVPYMVGNKVKNIYNNDSFNYDEKEFERK